jgi:NSS family neurotransmitter:Na+ symporter
MSDRETWASRLGFLLAAIGSAVGLGNIWQFPFKTATNGGAVFLVFYLVAVLLIGFPAMLAEFIIGRRTNRNAVDAFAELGFKQWRVVGGLGVFTGFWILSYYNVVGGWVMRYILGSATGAYFGNSAEYFGAIASGPEAVVGQALFLLICVGIVAVGVEDGIEKATKVMVPSIVLLMIGMAAWVTTLEGAGAGYSYFLSPDFSTLAANAGDLIPFAVGQAFFTLSLGMAAMITYSSYIGDDESLPVDGGIIVVTNTLVGVLAGLVVFPILFAINVSPDTSGPSAIFVAMASAFPQLPGGRLLGVVFFGVVLIAAISSAISLLEVAVSYGVDNTSYSRVSRGDARSCAVRSRIPVSLGPGVVRLVRHARVQAVPPAVSAAHPGVRRLGALLQRSCRAPTGDGWAPGIRSDLALDGPNGGYPRRAPDAGARPADAVPR